MPPLALYIHWPFCKSKCPYCDFNSHVRESVDHAAWARALLSELRHYASLVPGHLLTSIFFGGGTPSLMEPRTVAALIDEAQKLFPATENLEITLEANPTSVEAGRFRDFRSAGVNRVSLGVQSLNADDLSFLGREHSANEAMRAVELAGNIFPRHNFDLIYARPEQTPQMWEKELRAALPYANGHLSLYQLTIEEGTAFHHAYHQQKKFTLPEEDHAAELYELTQAICEEAGLPAYETSNHARPGEESRHNLAYWKGHSYLGIGPGAHGRIPSLLPSSGLVIQPEEQTRQRANNASTGCLPPSGEAAERHQNISATLTLKSPERWLATVERDGHGTQSITPLSTQERIEERLMMGLRLREGLNLASFPAQTGLPFDEAVNGQGLAMLLAEGLLLRDATSLRASPRGRLLLTGIASALV